MADTAEQAREMLRDWLRPLTLDVAPCAIAPLAAILAERDALAAKLAQAEGRLHRRGDLRCDECNRWYTRQMLPVHSCAALAQEPAPAATWRDHGENTSMRYPEESDLSGGATDIAPPASAPAEPVAPLRAAAVVCDQHVSGGAIVRWAGSGMPCPPETLLYTAAAIAAARREVRERYEPVRVALADLVALKRAKDALDAWRPSTAGDAVIYHQQKDNYARQKPAAWEAASAALRSLGDE